MRFLLINQHYPPDPAPTGTLLSELARTLAARGHDITVLTGHPTYDEARETKPPKTETREGVRVVRLPILPRTSGFWGRLVHYASFAFSILGAGFRERRPHAILAFSSTPLGGGLSTLLLSRARGIPFIYCVQDVYPDIAVAVGVLRPGFLAGVARCIEGVTWRCAHRLVLIGHDLEQSVRSRGVHPEKIAVIPNWADPERIRPVSGRAIRREAGVGDDDFVVGYAGNFGRSQDLETILEAARLIEENIERLRDKGWRPVKFLLVGGGTRAQEIREYARRWGSVRVLPLQRESRVSEVLSAADLSLVPLRKGLTRLSVPSKIYSIVASGRAVGASVDPGSEVERIIREAECGFWVEPGDAESLAREILHLAKDAERVAQYGKNARAWAERHGTLEQAANAYESLLVRAASKR